MSEESTPGPVSPPSDPTPKKAPAVKFDAKTVAIGILSVLSALGATGVIPPFVAPAAPTPPAQCSDPAFQSDVRAALAKLADQQADMRERMARVESALGAGTVR